MFARALVQLFDELGVDLVYQFLTSPYELADDRVGDFGQLICCCAL
jgi:hypothetical protein